MNRADGPRQILVTGASRGIGAALTGALAARGDRVRGLYRSAHAAARAVEASAGEDRVRLESVDLADPSAVATWVASLGEPATTFDGVVFNAGLAIRAAFDESEVAGLDPIAAQLRVDLQAPLSLCRALLRADRLADRASLVFVSSNLARHGLTGKVAYGAAKAGIEGAVRGLAKELGPRGLRVNAVAPGLLRTDMTADAGELGYAAYAAEVPLGRIGEPHDVCGPIMFLLGEEAAYVSGQVIDVDGGWGA